MWWKPLNRVVARKCDDLMISALNYVFEPWPEAPRSWARHLAPTVPLSSGMVYNCVSMNLMQGQGTTLLLTSIPPGGSRITTGRLMATGIIIMVSCYYTSDSLWKIWLVQSIQSIHNSLWTWHDKCNICCRYCIYLVKFKVCLVTKPLGVLSSETKWLNASLLFLKLCEKCIIKQLLNLVFAWYHELSKPCVCVICLSLRLQQITQTSVLIIHAIMVNLIQ